MTIKGCLHFNWCTKCSSSFFTVKKGVQFPSLFQSALSRRSKSYLLFPQRAHFCTFYLLFLFSTSPKFINILRTIFFVQILFRQLFSSYLLSISSTWNARVFHTNGISAAYSSYMNVVKAAKTYICTKNLYI